MIRPTIFLGFILIAGCGNSGLDNEPPNGANVDAQASGTVNGTFKTSVRCVFNAPGALGFTKVNLISPKSPGAGIYTFGMSATILGAPAVGHWGEREAQISASMRLVDDTFLASDVNSQNRIDITKVGGTVAQDDGSIVFEVHGTAAGTVSSRESNKAVDWIANF